MNATNGKIVKELPIGDGCDGVAFDPGNNTVYSANGEGTLTVIKEVNGDKYEVLEQAPTKKGARTIALDPATHLVYLPTADFEAPKDGQQVRGRRPMLPGTFQILVVGK